MGRDMNRGHGHLRSFHRSGPTEIRGVTKRGSELPWLSDQPGAAAVIDEIMAEGDAIIFGATSDGGAVSITVLAGKERWKAYASDDNELAEIFAELNREYPRANRDVTRELT